LKQAASAPPGCGCNVTCGLSRAHSTACLPGFAVLALAREARTGDAFDRAFFDRDPFARLVSVPLTIVRCGAGTASAPARASAGRAIRVSPAHHTAGPARDGDRS